MSDDYLKYGKCISCKFWRPLEGNQSYGQCLSPFSKEFHNVDFNEELASCTATSGTLITGGRFGCIHWRQGENRGRR